MVQVSEQSDRNIEMKHLGPLPESGGTAEHITVNMTVSDSLLQVRSSCDTIYQI